MQKCCRSYLAFPLPLSLSMSMVLTSEYLLPRVAGAEPFFFRGEVEKAPFVFLGEEDLLLGGEGDEWLC